MKRVGQLDQFSSFPKPAFKPRAEGSNDPLTTPLLEDAGMSPKRQRKSPTVQIISTSLNRRNVYYPKFSTRIF